jgi:hypothetical protein
MILKSDAVLEFQLVTYCGNCEAELHTLYSLYVFFDLFSLPISHAFILFRPRRLKQTELEAAA